MSNTVIGEAIKKRRLELGFNQHEAAKFIGIGQGTLSRIETGKSLPGAFVAEKINEKLQLTIDYGPKSRKVLPGRPIGYSNQRKTKLGEFITKMRIETGMNQQQLSLLAGTARTYIWEIENGHTSPTPAMIKRLEQALGCSIPDDVIAKKPRKLRSVEKKSRSVFAQFVIDKRVEQGLSMRALAQKSKLDPSIISKIENDILAPSVYTMEKISVGIGCTIPDEVMQEALKHTQASKRHSIISLDGKRAALLFVIQQKTGAQNAAQVIERALTVYARTVGVKY